MYTVNEFAGLLFKQAREEKGWDQQYLADEINVDVRTIRKIEAGKSDIQFDILSALIQTLKVSPQILFYADQTEKGIKMDRIYRELLQLPVKDIYMVTESAIRVRKWLDKHSPDGQETESDTQ